MMEKLTHILANTALSLLFLTVITALVLTILYLIRSFINKEGLFKN